MKLRKLIPEGKSFNSKKAAKLLKKYPKLYGEYEYFFGSNEADAIMNALDSAEEGRHRDKKMWDEAKRFMIEIGLLEEVNPDIYASGKGSLIKYKGKHYDYVTHAYQFFR